LTRIDADELAALLRAHGYLTVERPPQLWGLITTGLEPFVRALGESIAAGLLRNANDLGSLTLSVANVVDEERAEFVAVSVRGTGSWTDAHWQPGSDRILCGRDLTDAITAAGAVSGYTRSLGDGTGSVTMLYPRAA
jgi:hypothetical protein